jgi:dCTP diphosphatase
LMENFQWLSEQQSADLDTEIKNNVEEEIADILLYLIRLADKLDIDILSAAEGKFIKNEISC